MIYKAAVLAVLLGALPPLIGSLWISQREDGGNMARDYLYGLFTMLALFELFAVPMSVFRMKLTALCLAYLGALGLLAAAALVRGRTFPAWRRWLKSLPGKATPVLAAALVCMLLQAGYVTQRQHIDEDDAFYVATAVTSVQKNSLYKYSPYTGKKYTWPQIRIALRYIFSAWPLFTAVLSQVSGMHAAVIAHMILPAVTLLWLYLVYFLLGAWLFPGQKDRQSLFMLFVVLLLSFSGFSIYSSGVFSLVRGWQGKAVLAGTGLTLLLYTLLQAHEAGRWDKRWSLVLLVTAGCVTLSSMGIFLCCILTGSFGVYHAVRGRKPVLLLRSAAACLPAFACAAGYMALRALIR